WVREYDGEDVSLSIGRRKPDGSKGHVVRKLSGSADPGINRVVWDLQAEREQRLGNPHNLPEFVAPGT
ncbi:MAG: hypothetical protein GTN89_16475, partial [Acidobacteria bacterium]|nr:hypothetical protein [Acidobacteriota bacterium]